MTSRAVVAASTVTRITMHHRDSNGLFHDSHEEREAPGFLCRSDGDAIGKDLNFTLNCCCPGQ